MLRNGQIWMGNTDRGEEVSILLNKANRHGLVAGATGTGKTTTLRVMAEAFSDAGVPVFLADVKGDIAGLSKPGEGTEAINERIAAFGMEPEEFAFRGFPVTFWDVFGKNGVQLRTTITEMGPMLLSRILQLNDLQTDIMSICFKIADDEGLLLVDTKDLKSMLNYVDENSKTYAASYGKISPASIGAIMRALVALELDGGDHFFGEPALAISDLMQRNEDGKGMINILDSQSLVNNGRLYSTFLLWMISELYETLPEVGDLDKPKMVFFFDEAHLLFNGASKALLDKIDQVVKLIRSKGVGIYFCTQNPKDIPDSVLAQLGNKVQHALRAYTPAEQKGVKAAAESYRVNPEFDTYTTLIGLGTGEAVVSFLGEDGTPDIARKVRILPPQSNLGAISDEARDALIKSAFLYSKYAVAHDPDSAYEFLQRRGVAMAEEAAKLAAEEAKRKEEQRAAAEAAKQAEKEAKEAAKAAEKAEKEAQKAAEKEAAKAAKEAEKAANAKKKAAKQVGSSVAGTVGREVGKAAGKTFGSFGKTLGGNLGASLGRGIFSTLFKS